MSESGRPGCCPFCGSEDTSIDRLGIQEWFVGCNNDACKANGSSFAMEAEAIAAWNVLSRQAAEVRDLRAALETIATLQYADDPGVYIRSREIARAALNR